MATSTAQILANLNNDELLRQARKMQALKDSGGAVHPLLPDLKTELVRRNIEAPAYLQPE